MPDRSIDHREAVFAGNGLFATGLLVHFGSAEAGQDIGRLCGIEVAAVELCRDHHDKVLLGPAFLHSLLIGDRAHQVSTKRNETPYTALDKALYRVHYMHSVPGGRIEIEQCLQPVHRHKMCLFCNADGTLALHVGMSAHGAAASSGATDIAAQQQQVHHHRDIERTMSVLGKAHAVDADHLVSLDIDLRSFAQRGLGQAAGIFDIGPVGAAAAGNEFVEPGGVLGDEIMMDDFARPGSLCGIVRLHHHLAQAKNRGDIAAGFELMILIGNDGFLARRHFQRILRIDEGDKALFDHGIEGDDLSAAILQILQIVQETRTVGAGILAEVKITIGLVQIVERHGAHG